MCGIAGFIGVRDDELIKQFSVWLKHRGPDGEGYFIDDNVTLLSRRLAIIDVARGDQPIYNEDESIVIVYNGEIYNYRELRLELEKKGHVFKTVSDTEVILHGYEEWGDTSFDKLNGMFGVAIYDKEKKRTVLARDHFGIKPLYFASVDRAGLMFSSEIKPLIYSGLIPVEPNDRVIYRYLKYRIHDDGRETFFKGVERLLPGEMMVIDQIQNSKFKIQIKKYTNLEEKLLTNVETKHTSTLQLNQITEFKSLLIDSITKRLISEVPVGTCLSGGLDSSTVVAVVKKLLHDKVGESKSVGDIQKTFSAVFPGSSNDEEIYIDKLLETSTEIKDYKVYPNGKEFLTELRDFIKTQEEPTISTGPYAQYKVMQEAHKHVTVVLDGQGADEMMAGYIPYYFVYLGQLWTTGKYSVFFKEVVSSLDVVSKFIKNKIKGSKSTPMAPLFNKEFAKNYHHEKFTVNNSNLKQRLQDDIFKNSLPSLLRYEDKNAMRFSIEGRVPFLDFRLLLNIFSLPDSAIISSGWNKYILRRATENILPPLINKRRNKIGFTTPEHEWFIKQSKEIMSYFTGESFLAKKYVNQAQVVMAFQDFLAGKTDDTMVFWRILNLELWMREFLGKMTNESPSFAPPNRRATVGKQNPNVKKAETEIKIEGKCYSRYPIRTDVFRNGDNIPQKISQIIHDSLLQYNSILKQKKWFVVVSEKVVATAQGRAYFIWDIHPSFFAAVLSRFVSRVSWGIGLGSPWTMQLAIQEVGLPRIFLASILGALGKLGGFRGVFYKIAGRAAAGIDGPTEYSLYPANVSAKLLPKEPEKVCEQIDKILQNHKLQITKTSNFQLPTTSYLGSVIIDANDIGQNVLGNTTKLPSQLIENIFKDNPMGQSDEQTPVTLVIMV
ncbi:asparagine synthase (glutamine-hydrolyzing) [Candidatus Roizmanbacteria bacterium CG_4_10_14_0_8_um_filter_39_9]|uniref:asparagine synthase (glutamine-hydrolyzing) n=1 Tax=Candidatus Roizmanbacteria bacterium CG_4_10_14_0_8_um_filter_39_9 TaxID=1974829 RepID=A0A2M7QFK0_9BACT|nr:MAG: asparagine synthase (glutamine-hydrolyzing) [Candidatus Roizmanbacteria bacterium CG_4_10_14_0_8_um_filter_39_9]